MTTSDIEAQRIDPHMLTGERHLFADLGFHDVDADGCDLAMEMPVTAKVSNTRGALQGGLIATLVDVVAGRAAVHALPPGFGAATSDMTLHYLSGVTVGPARAEARVLRAGKRMVVVQVDVYDTGRNVLSTTATATFVAMELREGQLDYRGPMPRKESKDSE
ncbi:MAG TPA: PaaI family thioesterase [Mycobacteriales bacterium]|nr:PaaI family thioesterase [Mycobacteriales bacterium]HVW80525.1 PaaI family thioesterase [Mycobacteriales bacterium]